MKASNRKTRQVTPLPDFPVELPVDPSGQTSDVLFEAGLHTHYDVAGTTVATD